ncbi:MAG: FadR family transcriptional regulator [Acidobacteria bacterium]|nr:FadR family transcriptional regulator [Acidobacteriota bacterium]
MKTSLSSTAPSSSTPPAKDVSKPSRRKASRVIESARLPDRIYEQILEQIISEKFAIGDRLPSENQLAAEYNVSRAVVREAFSRLIADEVVTSRQGAGTFVQRRPGREFLRLAPIGGVADLMRCFEFRIALEGEAAHLAAQRRTEEDMAAIDDAFAKLDEANSASEVGVQQDIDFHMTIARASRNQLFVQTLDALALHTSNGMNVTRRLSLTRHKRRLLLVQEEHRNVLETIRASDEEGARRAMRTHIDNARHRALGDSVEPESL